MFYVLFWLDSRYVNNVDKFYGAHIVPMLYAMTSDL